MDKCAKCGDNAKGGAIYVEAGVAYPFCKTCTEILETFPVPANIMHIFLTPEERQSQETKNIFDARERRLKGEKLWVGPLASKA